MPVIPAFSRTWGHVCVPYAFLQRLGSAALRRFDEEFQRIPSVDLGPSDAVTLERLRCYLEREFFDGGAALREKKPAEHPAPLPLSWLLRRRER